jgi:hypothetical protein
MSKQHVYEVQARVIGGRGRFAKVLGGEPGAVAAAREILRESPEVVEVGVYHSWPSPGPQRRHVRTITREQ